MYIEELDLDINKITVNAVTGANVILSEELAKYYSVQLRTDDGEKQTYWVMRSGANRTIKVEFADVYGNIIAEKLLNPNDVLVTNDVDGGAYDVEKKEIIRVYGWYWDLDGEGSLYSEAKATSFTEEDARIIGGSVVTVYPKVQRYTPESASIAYLIYHNVGGVNKIYTQATDAQSFKNDVDAAPKEAYAVIFADGDFFDIGAVNVEIGKGKTFSLDLNGKTFIRNHTTNYPNGIFNLDEGAVLNVTSTVDGARIFSIDGMSSDVVYGTGGLVYIKTGVDKATVNLSNFEFNGGTLIRSQGGESSADATPITAGGEKIRVTLEGLEVFSPLRSSYAIICNLAPDLELVARNCKFMVSHETYAMIHDYQSTGGTYYFASSDISLIGCEIVAKTLDGKNAKFIYNLNKGSKLHLENTKIAGKFTNGATGTLASISIGKGVVIATSSFGYFDNFNVTYADGVAGAFNRGGINEKLDLSFSYSGLRNKGSYVTSKVYDRAQLSLENYSTIEVSDEISFF